MGKFETFKYKHAKDIGKVLFVWQRGNCGKLAVLVLGI